MNLPAIEPDAPRLLILVVGRCSQRPMLLLERPKEQRVIRVAWSIDADVPRPATRQGECNIRKGLSDFEVCCRVSAIVAEWR